MKLPCMDGAAGLVGVRERGGAVTGGAGRGHEAVVHHPRAPEARAGSVDEDGVQDE